MPCITIILIRRPKLNKKNTSAVDFENTLKSGLFLVKNKNDFLETTVLKLLIENESSEDFRKIIDSIGDIKLRTRFVSIAQKLLKTYKTKDAMLVIYRDKLVKNFNLSQRKPALEQKKKGWLDNYLDEEQPLFIWIIKMYLVYGVPFTLCLLGAIFIEP